jgi:bifunctional non-homologous end joining protein LigD
MAKLCMWAFDLLHLDGEDLCRVPFVLRKFMFEKLVYKTLDDGVKLLAAAERMGLEGIVSKRRDRPYQSGNKCEWFKVKSVTMAGRQPRPLAPI